MNAPGLRRITGRHYESACGEYSVRRMVLLRTGGGAAWFITRQSAWIGDRQTLRAAARAIDADKTRRATEILTVGVEVPF